MRRRAKADALAKASNEELIEELRRRLTGAMCPSCKSATPAPWCTNRRHLEQAMLDAMPGGIEATY